jgi:hypothetical protein
MYDAYDKMMGGDWLVKEVAKRYTWSMINDVEKLSCTEVLAACGGGEAQNYTFCTPNLFTDLASYDVLI